MKRLICFILFVCVLTTTYAQKNTKISGKVTTEDGEPIVGATVVIKGTSKGTVTNFDGAYNIEVAPESVLSVSFIGFETEEIVVRDKLLLNVILHPKSEEVEEVTVVAYGVQKKETLTGAISSVRTEALVNSPSGSVANALAGQLTGVSSVQVSGQPGADDAQLFVRGVGSLTEGGAQPLILVDGVERSFFQMDPNEIESVNVLKDASATAVFGVRGANGVIMVTTRRGQEGKARISVSSSAGVQVPTRLLKIADSYTYASVFNQAQRNDGIPEDMLAFTPYDLERFRLGDEPIIYPDVDWMDYLTNNAALQSNHNVNISGGTNKLRYFTSVGYLYQDGLFKKLDGLDYDNNFSYKRYNYRVNLDLNMSPTTTLKINIGGIVGNRKEPKAQLWQNFARTAPFASAGVIDGKKVSTYPERFPGVEIFATVFDAYYGTGTRQNISNTMNLDMHLAQELDFISKGLSFQVKGAYNTNYSYTRQVTGHIETYTPFYYSELMDPDMDIGDEGYDKTIVYRVTGQKMERTYGNVGKARGRNWYVEGSLRYNRKFGEHNVGGLFLYNQSKKYYPGQFSDVPTAYVGLVGRVTYDYKTRYMAEFNVGYNGSENFAPGKRYGTFPAGSVGYIVSEEPFFPQNKILSYLKFRASVGLVGNDNMSGNRFLYLPDSYAINSQNALSRSYGDYNGYVFGLTNTKYEDAAYELRLGNPNVTWETALKRNFGADIKFFDNRFNVTVDYFRENRKDILIQRKTIPNLVSLSSKLLPVVNMGKVNNKGYEIDLKWNDRVKELKYNVQGNVSYSRNKIIFQDEIEPNEPYMMRTGHPVGTYFGYVEQGFYSKDDFDEEGNLVEGLPERLGTVKPGDIKFADLNDDGIVDGDDITKIGSPKRPAYTFGINYGLDYKGFSVSMKWIAATQCDIMLNHSFKSPFGYGSLYQYQADNSWTEETAETAIFPRISMATGNPNGAISRIWLRDVSYLKLKNMVIGYNISNKKILNAIGASAIGIKLTGYNLLTFDKLKIFDPEGELSRDGNTYPIVKIYSLGVNVTF